MGRTPTSEMGTLILVNDTMWQRIFRWAQCPPRLLTVSPRITILITLLCAGSKCRLLYYPATETCSAVGKAHRGYCIDAVEIKYVPEDSE